MRHMDVQSVIDAAPPVVFDDLYQREYRPLVAFAYALSGSWGSAEELAQDAFLAAFRDWERVRSYSVPEAWLRRAVANRSVSRWRRLASESRALIRIAHRPERAGELELGLDDEFWAAVRALPRRQAEVVTLHYLEDRTVDEIAAVLDIAAGTVKVHLHRARAALAAALELEVRDGD